MAAFTALQGNMQLGLWDGAVLQLKHLKQGLGVTIIYGSEEQRRLWQKSPVFMVEVQGDAGKYGLITWTENT